MLFGEDLETRLFLLSEFSLVSDILAPTKAYFSEKWQTSVKMRQEKVRLQVVKEAG
jgi:hypothetical protein